MKRYASFLSNNLILALITSVLLAGCTTATWSSSGVTNIRPSDPGATTVPASQIILTEGDITDRKYSALGDISVEVNKMTIFHSDPTREQVDEKLREEAAKLGADAVILIRYGTIGISAMSWGSLDGKGRAIKFAR